jgi:hypothetical protein
MELTENSARKISYRPGTLIIEGTTTAPSEGLVRVFSEKSKNLNGAWIVHKSTISKNGELMTAEEIKNLLNIPPEIPDSIVNVKIPPGTRIRISEVAHNDYGTKEGAVQIKIIADKIENFFEASSIRRLPK